MDLRTRNMTAADWRREEGLPDNGRGIEDLVRMEAILRETLDPEIPIFDFHTSGDPFKPLSVSYTDGIGLFILRPNFIDLAVRIALLAAQQSPPKEPVLASDLIDGLGDKWTPEDPDPSPQSCVFFPPGRNLRCLVNWDNVAREFDYESSWRIKPHPVGGTAEYIDEAYVSRFGASRVLHPKASGWKLMEGAGVVGYTTASELGLAALMKGKDAIDFTRHSHAAHGNYYPLYRAMENIGAPAFERIVNCEWSGYIPLGTESAEAQHRMTLCIEKLRELDRIYRPLVDLPPLDDRHD